jgi:hypothetical protein
MEKRAYDAAVDAINSLPSLFSWMTTDDIGPANQATNLPYLAENVSTPQRQKSQDTACDYCQQDLKCDYCLGITTIDTHDTRAKAKTKLLARFDQAAFSPEGVGVGGDDSGRGRKTQHAGMSPSPVALGTYRGNVLVSTATGDMVVGKRHLTRQGDLVLV